MYLKNIIIKNIGPISELSVELPFNEGGIPKPLLFVGENGSGKTILLSQIIDSFYEIGGSIFDDIKISKGMGHKYFKVSGGVNLKIGQSKGFSGLQFGGYDKNIEYLDKMGEVTIEDVKKNIQNFILSPTNKENQKLLTSLDDDLKKKLENNWLNGVYFYQPAYRYEEPFWKVEDFKHEEIFSDTKRYSGELKKEIEIVSSNKENKQFILDLILDNILSKNSINTLLGNNPQESMKDLTILYQVQTKVFDITLWDNINEILKKVKQNNNIEFHIGQRGGNRISIFDKNTNTLLPMNNLSLGESVLLNLFINIVRHACQYNSKPLNEITGIVAIDEIDIHLHSDLQSKVLPKLINLFPKVQFIVTTHSPLFLLGMKKEFGENNFEIRNMPSGEVITTERFSEFENAYRILKQTEKFEKDIKEEIEKVNKPILYVEDEYYQIYQIAYLKLNNIECDENNFEEKFKNEAFFSIHTGKSAGGVAGLLRVKDVSIFKDKKIVGLWDFDKEGRENFHHLSKGDDKKIWDKEEKGNKTEGFYKKRNDHSSMYALLLPIPERLEHLVSLEWENFSSYVEIENLLPEEFLKDNNFVEEKKILGTRYYKCKKNVKNRLWKKLFQLNKEDFKDFENIYKFLEEKTRVKS